jgi:hypothetical protein
MADESGHAEERDRVRMGHTPNVQTHPHLNPPLEGEETGKEE